jgi:hypothetical protein
MSEPDANNAPLEQNDIDECLYFGYTCMSTTDKMIKPTSKLEIEATGLDMEDHDRSI